MIAFEYVAVNILAALFVLDGLEMKQLVDLLHQYKTMTWFLWLHLII